MLSEKPWRIEAVIEFIGAQFVCFFLGILVATLLQKLGVSGFRQDNDFGNILFFTLSFQGATWILIPFFLRRHGINWRNAFGFRDDKLKNTLALAVGTLVLFAAPATWWWQETSAQVLPQLGWPVEDQVAVKLLMTAKSWWTTVYLGVFAVVLAPVAEEFIFRGMLYPLVKQLGSPRYAFFGISAIFAEIHFDMGTLVPLFVLALALTWLYEKTDNLLAPITAHALFNAVNYAVLLWQNRPAHA